MPDKHPVKKPEVKIIALCDGWNIYIDNRYYHFNHNDDLYGTKALEVLFKDLGFKVEWSESY